MRPAQVVRVLAKGDPGRLTRVMPAICIRQPWAELIMRGDKSYEIRKWPTRFRGRIVIVASKGIDFEACEARGLTPIEVAHLATGSALGSVKITSCDSMKEGHEGPSCVGYWDSRLYAWGLMNPHRFLRTIATRGRLGIFRLEVPQSYLPLEETA